MLLWRRVPRICHDQVAGGRVVSVCDPMDAADPRALLFLVVLVLLLLPELAEVEIAGVFSLKRVLEQTQEQVKAIQAAVFSLSLSLSQRQSMTVFLGGDRQAGSGVASLDAEAGDSAVRPTTGAFSQTAFEAGVMGLRELLPPWGQQAAIRGFTISEEGRLDLSFEVGATDHDAVARAQASFEGETYFEDTRHRRVIIAPASGDLPGELVGAVAVSVSLDVAADEESAPSDIRSMSVEDMAADVEVVAGAYARLLLDLLHEPPHPLPRNDPQSRGH